MEYFVIGRNKVYEIIEANSESHGLFLKYICLFCFWATFGGAQVLFLALHSGVTPNWLGRPYVVLGIKNRLAMCKAYNALVSPKKYLKKALEIGQHQGYMPGRHSTHI